MPKDMEQFNTEQRAEESMEKARLHCILDYPLFAGLLTRLPMEISYYTHTAWTDGRRIGMNPYMVDKMEFEHIKGAIIHEVGHVMFKHMLRRGEREPKTWNEAGDYVINALIKTTKGLGLPAWTLLDMKRFADSITEDVYLVLWNALSKAEQDARKNGSNGPRSKPDGTGNQGDAGQMSEGYKNGSIDPKSGKGIDPSSFGEVIDVPGEDGKEMTPSEKAAYEAEIDTIIRQSVTIATKRGQMPVGSDEAISAAMHTKTNWYDELEQFLVDMTDSDYTWKAPKVDFVGHGVYMPSIEGEGLPPVVLAIDVSGSVTKDQLEQCSREVIEIVQTFGCDVYVLYFNTKVVGTQHVEANDLDPEHFTLTFQGSGGTCFKDITRYIEEELDLDDDIYALLVFTDMECNSYPRQEPDYPVIWCEFKDGDRGCYHSNPPWGEHILIDLNQ